MPHGLRPDREVWRGPFRSGARIADSRVAEALGQSGGPRLNRPMIEVVGGRPARAECRYLVVSVEFMYLCASNRAIYSRCGRIADVISYLYLYFIDGPIYLRTNSKITAAYVRLGHKSRRFSDLGADVMTHDLRPPGSVSMINERCTAGPLQDSLILKHPPNITDNRHRRHDRPGLPPALQPVSFAAVQPVLWAAHGDSYPCRFSEMPGAPDPGLDKSGPY